MTSTHRMLASVFVWIVFAWSATVVYGLALTLMLPAGTLVGVVAFLVGAAVLATLLLRSTT